jgi:probable selenate reductase FAD-binding subunit
MLPKFDYIKAGTVDEAVSALASYGNDARVLAGGTDLLIAMQDGVARPKYLIDIKSILELRKLEVAADGGLAIGACVTVNELLAFRGLPAGMEALHEAAGWLGTNQVRNRATVGGNLCNASPACDLGPPLLVLGASLKAVTRDGERLVDLKDFFTCPKQSCLLKEELVTEIRVPAAAGMLSGFAKRTRIRGHDLAVVNAAASVRDGAHLRVALGAVAPRPVLIDGLDRMSLGDTERILGAVAASIAPIDDVRGSGAYRAHIARVLLARVIRGLDEKARKPKAGKPK